MNWRAIVDEGVVHLRHAIQLQTINPPGNEIHLARYLDGVLAKAGIETRLFEPSTGRAALIARLRGNGTAAPMLMTAHMDVVGVEPDQWSVPPFGGDIRDGYIYGRGAIDDKGMLVAELMTMLALKRHVDAGRALAGDVIYLASSDEEAGGDWGLGWVMANHADEIRAAFAINEGGRIRIVDGRPLYAAVQCAEKSSHVVTVSATGPAGHASIPLEGNAVVRLARAIATIARYRPPVMLGPTTHAFFSSLATVWPHPTEARAMTDVVSVDPARVHEGAAVLEKSPLFNAVLRSGISPTMLDAGVRHNVIPAEATATMSVRTVPGDSIDALVQLLRELVADPQIEIAVTDRGTEAPASPHDGAPFVALRDAITELDASITTVPYVSPGATENAMLRVHGIPTYGLLPFPMNEDDERRMHGADERLSLEAFEFGIKLLCNVCSRTQGLLNA